MTITIDCPDCEAQGTVKEKCGTCDGEGLARTADGEGYIDDPCPDCEDGEFDATCNTCDGDGTIEQE